MIRSKLRVISAVVVALMIFGSLNIAVAEAPKGFETPEAAIKHFIERVRNEDYDGALKACAVNEIAAGYDYEVMIKRLRVMTLNDCLIGQPASGALMKVVSKSEFRIMSE
jgi:hypothetical protein